MKYFRTLKEARAYLKADQGNCDPLEWFRLKTGKVYKYAVCTYYEWRTRGW